jgi:hypothetical protein
MTANREILKEYSEDLLLLDCYLYTIYNLFLNKNKIKPASDLTCPQLFNPNTSMSAPNVDVWSHTLSCKASEQMAFRLNWVMV